MTAERQRLGQRGEDAATRWYVARGYDVVARNWRCRRGELDLILRRGDTLVFCEVKTRASVRFGSPYEAVTAVKAQRIRSLALEWLAETQTRAPNLRFDVAGVRLDGGQAAVDVVTHAF